MKWTKEKCENLAKLYEYRIDFKKNSRGAYDSARVNGWLDEICFHMKPKGNKFKRLIYSFVFSDNYVYVGLTGNPEIRKWSHLNKSDSQVYKHISETGLDPIYKELTDYLPIDKSIKMENYWMNKMKDDGYVMLNINKTGALGGNIVKWNKNDCKKAFLFCKNIKEVRSLYSTAYSKSVKNRWIGDFSKHMKYVSNGKWNNKENCQSESLKYSSRTEFKIKSSGAYYASIRNGWLNEICLHMKNKRKSRNYWNKDRCREAFLICNSMMDFRENFSRAYSLSLNNKWINEF